MTKGKKRQANHVKDQRRVADLEMLHQVGLALASIQDPDEFVQRVVDIARESFGYYYVVFLAYDAADDVLWPAAYCGEPSLHSSQQRIPLGEGITGLAAQQREPIIVADASADPRYAEGAPDWRSGVALPILRGEHLFGVLSVTGQERDVFDEEAVRTLTALANQIAVALENARFYQEALAAEQNLEQQVEVLTTLLSMAHALQAPGDLQPKLDLVAQGIVDAGLWGRAVISVFDDEWRAVAIGTAGLTSEEVTVLQRVPHRSREERMQFYDERFRISASYYIPHDADVSAGCVESHRRAEEFVDWHPDDRLLVPLYGEGGRIIGQLSVDDPVDGRRPTAESLKPLELFASQAAVAVENDRLFVELQLVNKDLEAMLDSQLELLKAVQELSSPVVPIFEGVLVVPLIGTIDFSRAQQITHDLLTAIETERARFAIIDITGVSMVDSHVARYLADAMLATRLIGAEPVLVGITPAVAQTMVEIRAELGDVTTRSDLQSGVAYALRQSDRERQQRNPDPAGQSERET